MIESDDTLSFFFSTNDFATTATFAPFIGPEVTITGILDNPYLAADAGGIVEFSSTSPTFMTKTSDLPDLAYGDTLEIGSTTYMIREIMPDGTGITTLALEEQ